MAIFTAEQIISHPLYKKAWDAYDVWFQNGKKWPADIENNYIPVPPEVGATTRDNLNYAAWQAGSWSACDAVWERTSGIPPRTPPGYKSEPEQLDLFEGT